ncbi:MAG TPA: GNAT family N-acetyltransferase, partial [Phenylobacterium sp.]|uniref:GNAT family N-acetyltransferase n=1 Tax=Phenylobacterium sp. TaxID=1871053 RepID=UPI002F93FED1
AGADESAACARIQWDANRVSLPFLPAEPFGPGILEFFANVLFAENEVWVADEGGAPVGYVAFHPGWVEHLYVLPDHQAQGVGPALLAKALEDGTPRFLWTFQKNTRARRFYESRGWRLVELTDGAGNREKEPDARYEWPGG